MFLFHTFSLPSQVNKDGSLRVSAGTRHNLTSDAGKSMDSVRSLVHNRAYLGHIDTLQVGAGTLNRGSENAQVRAI